MGRNLPVGEGTISFTNRCKERHRCKNSGRTVASERNWRKLEGNFVGGDEVVH